MSEVKVTKPFESDEYIEEKIVVDNIPDIGDKTGEKFLDNLEKAIAECRKFIADGYRLVNFWSDVDIGVEFTLHKVLKEAKKGEPASERR